MNWPENMKKSYLLLGFALMTSMGRNLWEIAYNPFLKND
jgi:hypothetical protein